jgi:curved DNA-binding protein CbpA
MGMLLLDSKPTNVAVNQALKKQAKRWHPDQSGDAEVFKQLQEAKTQLLKIC